MMKKSDLAKERVRAKRELRMIVRHALLSEDKAYLVKSLINKGYEPEHIEEAVDIMIKAAQKAVIDFLKEYL
jgi:SOS response regulatory protein OraA/RecX